MFAGILVLCKFGLWSYLYYQVLNIIAAYWIYELAVDYKSQRKTFTVSAMLYACIFWAGFNVIDSVFISWVYIHAYYGSVTWEVADELITDSKSLYFQIYTMVEISAFGLIWIGNRIYKNIGGGNKYLH